LNKETRTYLIGFDEDMTKTLNLLYGKNLSSFKIIENLSRIGDYPNSLIESQINEEQIDLMKIDIGGEEYSFFELISDSNLNKISKILIGFHKNYNFRVVQILEKLTANDFNIKLSKWSQRDEEYVIENNMGIIYAWK
jgi:hypothetical protein